MKFLSRTSKIKARIFMFRKISLLTRKLMNIDFGKKLVLCYVVLYGCETWSLTLREESRLRVFENRILRRIFGPKSGVEKDPQ